MTTVRAEQLPLARRAWHGVAAVLPQWAATRVITLGALALAHLVVDRVHPSNPVIVRTVHQGLLSWDAGYYDAIARQGYGSLGHEGLRFFPLFPLVGRALALAPGLDAGAALLVIANVSSLIGTALLYALVRRETDEARARRTVWILSLAPSAFVLVMGYAEGLFLVLSVACFLAIRPAAGRHPAWWWAAAFGVAAGLTRPFGILLVLPVAIEVARHWRRLALGERIGGVIAAAAPVAGGLAFMIWSQVAEGSFWLPLSVQTQSTHHGGLSDPLRTLRADAAGVLHHHYGTALHVPWALVAIVLLVVLWRRWPAPYGAFATAVIALGLSGTNLDSFERYALGAFPLAMAAATLCARPSVERSVLALLGAALAGYALLAFLGLSVP